jgi:hypothetical protein
MKQALILITVFASLSCFAGSNDGTVAAEWLKKTLEGRSEVAIPGRTKEDGSECALFISDKDLGLYFVVVGPVKKSHQNEYVGLGVGAANYPIDVEADASRFIFRSEHSWGNGSVRNTVTVEFNSDGSAKSATGVSDLKTTTCLLNPKEV